MLQIWSRKSFIQLIIFCFIFSGVLLVKMKEFRDNLYSELKKVLENIFKEDSSQNNLMSGNYLKLSKPIEWDKVVELHERLINSKCHKSVTNSYLETYE